MSSLVGRTLGRYRIIAELGEGGMGAVYRALDTTLGREVALKVLPPELTADPERRQQLVREAQTASRLEHPHIGVIHEVGDADGVSFIAMELIRGSSLRDIVQRGGLSVARALDLAVEIVEGLARAHDLNVIHRDLKPANVMVTEDGHAKIIDFGLAKLLTPDPVDTEAATAAASTAQGVIKGTAAYMSPEQARGQRLDARSDLFSFGTMLYQMASGRLPFDAPSTLEALHAIMHGQAPPVSLPAGGAPIAAEARQELQRILDKCLEKDPDARYQTARDLAVDLRALRRRLDGVSTGATAVAATTAAVPAARRSFRLSPVMVWSAIAVIVAAGATYWLTHRTPAPPPLSESGKPSVAVLYFQNNTGSQQFDWLRTGLTDMVVTGLSQSPDMNVLSTDRLYQILASLKRQNDPVLSFNTVQQVARLAGVEHVLTGNYVKAGETIRINLTLQDAASGRIVSAEHFEARGEDQLFPTVDTLTQRLQARLASTMGATRPTALLQSPGATPDPTGTGLYRSLQEVATPSVDAYRAYAQGVAFLESGRPRDAEPLLLKALEIDKGFALAMVRLAAVENNLRRPDKRNEYAERALANSERLSARDRYYIEGFRYANDEDTIERGAAAYEKLLALYPQHYAGTHNLADSYLNSWRCDDAIRLTETLRRSPVVLPITLSNLAWAYMCKGDEANANGALADYRGRFSESAALYRTTGGIALAFAKPDDARAAYEKADTIDGGDPSSLFDQLAIAGMQDRWSDFDALTGIVAKTPDLFSKFATVMSQAMRELYRGRSAAALAVFDKSRAAGAPWGPTFDALLATMQARTLLSLGRPALALPLAEAVRKVQGEIAVTPRGLSRYTMALSLSRLARDAEARVPLDEISARAAIGFSRREQERHHQLLGVLALDRRDTATAIAELTQAEALLPVRASYGPPPPHAEVWFALGSAYLAAGKDAEAERRFARLVGGDERITFPIEYVRSLYLLGQIAERRGDTDKAREYYRRYISYWGDGDMDRAEVADAKKKIG